jgi:nucleoid DNA-binding protein
MGQLVVEIFAHGLKLWPVDTECKQGVNAQRTEAESGKLKTGVNIHLCAENTRIRNRLIPDLSVDSVAVVESCKRKGRIEEALSSTLPKGAGSWRSVSWQQGTERQSMTKKEIAEMIAEHSRITMLLALEAVQLVFDGITETLVKEGRIELRNFGVFEVKRRRARKARNPRTGENVVVPARSVVTFKQGREMEQGVNKLARSHRRK